MALDGHSVVWAGLHELTLTLVADRYMVDGPSVIACQLPGLLRFLDRRGGQAAARRVLVLLWIAGDGLLTSII